MESLNKIYFTIKPMIYTFLFEIRLQVKKFIIFLVIVILQLFLNCYIRFITGSSLSGSLDWFYYDGTTYFVLIVTLAVCFFFASIICSEYKDKTGLTILPLINKYKLMIGKYIANLFLIIIITVIHYSFLILLGYYFYGGPIFNTWILSFGFSVLYIIALSSIVTFFSSFMPSPTPVIIIVFGLIYFALEFIAFYINRLVDLEPIYSLLYLSMIITNVALLDFDLAEVYISAEVVIAVFLIYFIFFFIFSLLLFKRREL